MGRIHLFEFGDLPWFPAALRDAMTAYLAAAYKLTPFPKVWASHLSKVLEAAGSNQVVDLGSGSGGPATLIVQELARLGRPVQFVLTDLYPPKNWPGPLEYWPASVDATRVPAALTGARTMFASFHHFRPTQARGILADAFAYRRAICVFEATARTPAAIAAAFLIPLLVLVLTPSIRPVSVFQLVFTYLVPILPFLIFWDGLVSQLRTYSADELKELTATLQAPDYRWQFDEFKIPGFPARVASVTGTPV